MIINGLDGKAINLHSGSLWFTLVHSDSLWFTPFHPRQTFLHYHSFTLVHPISFYLTHLHSLSSHFTLASRCSRVKQSEIE